MSLVDWGRFRDDIVDIRGRRRGCEGGEEIFGPAFCVEGEMALRLCGRFTMFEVGELAGLECTGNTFRGSLQLLFRYTFPRRGF